MGEFLLSWKWNIGFGQMSTLLGFLKLHISVVPLMFFCFCVVVVLWVILENYNWTMQICI